MERVIDKQWKSYGKGNGMVMLLPLRLGRDWGLSCNSNGKGNGKVMERVMEFTLVAALKAEERLRLCKSNEKR